MKEKLILDLTQELNAKLAKLLFRFTLTSTVVLVYFNATAQIANTISSADKVFGLSKFWQEVNYNFVYLNKINHQSWDSTYKTFISQVQATQNDYEYYRVLLKFCALLKDGHTEVFLPAIKGLNFMNNTFGDYLLVLKRVDNKVIVKRTWKKDAHKFPLGSVIMEVNGLPPEWKNSAFLLAIFCVLLVTKICVVLVTDYTCSPVSPYYAFLFQLKL